jgi:neutral ceramidase
MRVGCATVDVTPPVGLPLMGNFRDDYAARGVHDPLRAKAIVFADASGEKAAILAVDLCMLDRANVARIRESLPQDCGVPPANVLVHAIHTHSGPATNGRYSFGFDLAPHLADIDALLVKAASAVALAEKDLADADLAVGYGREERVSFNRRLRRRDGSTQMNWEALQPGFNRDEVDGAWGVTDPQLTCLVIERGGRAHAVLTNFGLHPAVLAGDNWLYSADYPGFLAEALGRALGGGLTSLFLNGCCGNVNHVDYRDPLQGRGYKMAQRLGYMLAVTAQEAIRARQPISADRISVSREHVALDRIRISPDELRRCRAVVEEARRNPARGQVDGLPEGYFADLRVRMHQQQETPLETEVMAIRLGDVSLVGLPGEVFCESGLEIKRRSPAGHTLVAELANDAIGYVPAHESYAHGGYETTIGSTWVQAGSAERLVASALRQLERL